MQCDFTVPKKPFEKQIIEDIYAKELAQFNTQRVMLLELSHYLEKYPHFHYTPAHMPYSHIFD